MSYFDDNEESIIFGRSPGLRQEPKHKKADPGSDLARARQRAHRAFDPTWQGGRVSRAAAYAQLAERLGLKKADCHMLHFDIATCDRVVALYTLDDFEALP